MAVKVDNAHVSYKAEERAEVSNCVSGIIEAFTNGLSIFKRLRERRKKRKARKENATPDPTSNAELQLSKSLKKGPQEVAERYAECYHSGIGPRFAKGDAIAHASLAETMIKLNTGLVGIIAAFLNHDHKSGKSHMDLDYKSLTNLSDASRREALQSMTQLYQRLSHSQLQLYNIGASSCPRCGSATHSDCTSRSTSPEKKKHTHSRQKSSGPVITRMPIKSSSQPQLVVMRPKNTRKGSNSSSSSNSAKSPPSSTYTSPLASPLPKHIQMAPQLPMYVPVEPFELHSNGVIKGTLGGGGGNMSNIGRQRIDSFDDSRPSTWPQHTYPYTKSPPKHLYDTPPPRTPVYTPQQPQPQPQHRHHHHSPPSPQRKPAIPSKPAHLSSTSSSNHSTLPHPPPTPMTKRRLDKATPSSYTFASDSTKLGEIPQRHWTKPYDYEDAQRRNAEAAGSGYPVAMGVSGLSAGGGVVGEDKAAKKKGLFKFLRKG